MKNLFEAATTIISGSLESGPAGLFPFSRFEVLFFFPVRDSAKNKRSSPAKKQGFLRP